VPSWGPMQWDADKQEAVLYYSQLSGVTDAVKSAIGLPRIEVVV